MSAGWQHAADLLRGPLPAAGRWPLTLHAVLCDLRPLFLPKRHAGRGCRAVARNGRVLLAANVPLPELAGRAARVRLQTWHRALLPGDAPQPYGILLCVDAAGGAGRACYASRLVRSPEGPFELALEVGGGLVLEFRGPALP